MPSHKTINAHNLVKKIKAYNKGKLCLKEHEKTFKRNCKPKPIGKGLEKITRIKKQGLMFKASNHKIKYLKNNLGQNKSQDGLTIDNCPSIVMNRQLLIAKMVNPKNQPFKHRNLDIATKL